MDTDVKSGQKGEKKQKHVALVGGIQAYAGDADEVWVINASFQGQVKGDYPLTRVYFFHNPKHMKPEFVDELNALPENVRVFGRKHWDLIPRSEEYPLQEVIDFFSGVQYFSSTACYMLAQAIMDGYDKITVAGMYYIHDSTEYFLAKPCMEMWLGIAMGMGIHIHQSEHSMLLRPYPWSTRLYGYKVSKGEILTTQVMSCSYRASLGFPISVVDADDLTDDEVLHTNKVAAVVNEGIAKPPDWVEREKSAIPSEEQMANKEYSDVKS